jgi:hypothetical protein
MGSQATSSSASTGNVYRRPRQRRCSGTCIFVFPSTGSNHIELPNRALVSVEAGIDATLVRTVLESLLR